MKKVLEATKKKTKKTTQTKNNRSCCIETAHRYEHTGRLQNDVYTFRRLHKLGHTIGNMR